MLTYTIRLTGPGVTSARLPGPLVADLFEAVDRSAKGAVRLRLEGRSSAKGGTLPSWLVRASAFELVELTQEFPGVRLQALTLREALPDKFVQTDFLSEIDPEGTGLTFMAQGLNDALHGRTDSDTYDDSLLGTFEEFGAVLRHDVHSLEIRNGRADSPVVEVNPAGLRTIQHLHETIPEPRRVRLAGKLDTIRYSDRAFTLVTAEGKTVRGVLAEGGPELLKPLFGRIAVISGMAHFRPSGRLGRVDAEHITIGTEDEAALWAEVPKPLNLPLDLQGLRRPQGPRTGLNAMIGKWPGDETDEEIIAALEELS